MGRFARERRCLDQARCFMTEFAKRLEEQGCEVSVAAKASQWHIERERERETSWNLENYMAKACLESADFRSA